MRVANMTGKSLRPLPTPLEAAHAQLLLYARDLRKLATTEQDETRRIDLLQRQLQLYARDLRRAYDAERRRSRELERAYHDTVRRLVTAAKHRDFETGAHVDRVSHYARLLALQMGWRADAADMLFRAAPMHDIGKIGIPDAILLKPGPLDPEERRIVERHTLLGAELLAGSNSPLLELARRIALSHHERWDGSGYPHHLRGEQIPAGARVVRLADEYDALRSARPYKRPRTHEDACDAILLGDGRSRPDHFDPRILAAFGELRERFRQIHERFHD